MTILELHYDFLLKIDKVASFSREDFNDAEIDWLLNEAQIVFVKQRYGGTNSKRTGFEMSQKRVDDLAQLHIPNEPITPVADSTGVYEVDLCNLSHTYWFLTRAYANVSAPGCEYTATLKAAQTDDLNDILDDPFNKPYKKEIPYNMGRASSYSACTSIYMYPPVDDTIKTVSLSYIKEPNKVSLGTYIYIDGVQYPATTFETAPHTHPEIVDIATQIASGIIEHPNYAQLKDKKVFTQE